MGMKGDLTEDSLDRLEAELAFEELGEDPEASGVPSRLKKPPTGRSGGAAVEIPCDDAEP